MERWLTSRTLSNHSNRYRNLPGQALHDSHRPSFRISRAHQARRLQGVASTVQARERCIILLHQEVPTHRTWTILWILPTPAYTHLDSWCSNQDPNKGNRLPRLLSCIRTKVTLGSHRNHQSPICHPLDRDGPRYHRLGSLLGFKPYN